MVLGFKIMRYDSTALVPVHYASKASLLKRMEICWSFSEGKGL